MSRHSLLVALVGLVSAGAVPVAVRLLTAPFARPAGRRSDAVPAGDPAHRDAIPVRRPAANDYLRCDCGGRPADSSRFRDPGTPGACPQNSPTRRVHAGNVLIDRGHGYVL